MASVERRGTSWRARYRTPDGRTTSKSFAKKSDAERFLIQVEHEKLTGAYVDPSAGKVTFRVYAESWRTAQVHRPSTVAQLETNLRRHAYPTFGDRPLVSVRPSEVQAWVTRLTGGLSPATVTLVYRYVAAVFRSAVADRVIGSSPCVGVKLPKVSPRRVDVLEVDQVAALSERLPQRYRALVTLAAGTGVRQGEAFGLTLDRLDFLRRTVTIDRQLVTLTRTLPTLGPTKTPASVRTIPLPLVVVDALAAHLAAFPAGESGLVFTNSAGTPIRRTAFSPIWRAAVAEAGLLTGTRYHDLRHFYASLLIRHGESVKVVQARLGHATAAETLDTYSHLWPDSEDRTRSAVDSVLGHALDTGARERATNAEK